MADEDWMTWINKAPNYINLMFLGNIRLDAWPPPLCCIQPMAKLTWCVCTDVFLLPFGAVICVVTAAEIQNLSTGSSKPLNMPDSVHVNITL